ncbi:MAG: hypothetical protein AAF390_01140 [Pseudomonadota bacterium]
MTDAWVLPDWGLLPAAVGLALVFWAALWLGKGAAAPRRVILSFLFRIALPMSILVGVPLVLLAQVVELEDRLWQALIAGSVIATGWLATAVFGESERRATKAERTRDSHKALFAEVQNALSAFYGEGQAAEDAAALVARMEADPDFVPFIPREHHDRVFAALMDEIEVLPRQTIDAIVAFYAHVAAIQSLADDMRGEGFGRLKQDRRIAIYRDYVAMRMRAFRMGEYVLDLIAAYAAGGVVAAERVAHQAGASSVSSLASDPNDPEDRGSA